MMLQVSAIKWEHHSSNAARDELAAAELDERTDQESVKMLAGVGVDDVVVKDREHEACKPTSERGGRGPNLER